MKRLITATIAFLALSLPVMAAEEVAKSNGQRILESLLPIVIIFTIVWFLIRKAGKRNEPYMERAKVHMDRLEKQNEEIIALLKRVAGKTEQIPEQHARQVSSEGARNAPPNEPSA